MAGLISMNIPTSRRNIFNMKMVRKGLAIIWENKATMFWGME